MKEMERFLAVADVRICKKCLRAFQKFRDPLDRLASI